MKNRKKTIVFGACLAVPVAVDASVTTVSNLEVGGSTSQPNNIYASSLASGYNNHSSYHSLVLGAHSYAHNSSFTVGSSNEVKNFSSAVGYLNDVNKNASSGYPRSSMVVGTWNYALANDSFATGWNNDLTGDQSTALGYALINNEDRATVVGEHNIDKADIRFAVGNGDDASNRSNALEVFKNGDVIVTKVQGDIGMGAFGN